jgi:hypothetical protein
MKLLLDANISWGIIKLVENDFSGCFQFKLVKYTLANKKKSRRFADWGIC